MRRKHNFRELSYGWCWNWGQIKIVEIRSSDLGIPFDELAQPRKAFSEFLKSDDFVNNDRFYIIDDQLCVDFVIRYEHLSEDLAEVCRRIGLPPFDLPHLKTGFRQRRHHYSEYYDDESKAIVAEKHRNDIRFFGYEFECV
jgi:hypothetical protein